ncbi:MAG: hypothetical protein HY302_08500 [Opitutae bacterium]|nr:hypothetical protein [Opitutae bacterium]
MKKFKDYVNAVSADLPREYVKEKAHLMTLWCVVASFFSLIGVFPFVVGIADKEYGLCMLALGVWGLHGWLIWETVRQWKTEKKKSVIFIRPESGFVDSE